MKWLSKGRWSESALWISSLMQKLRSGEEETAPSPREATSPSRSLIKKKSFARWKESAIKAFFFTNGVLAVVVLIGIFVILLYTAIPAFREISLAEFFTEKTWDPTSPEKAQYGLLSMIVSTLMCTAGALLFATPLGLGGARY